MRKMKPTPELCSPGLLSVAAWGCTILPPRSLLIPNVHNSAIFHMKVLLANIWSSTLSKRHRSWIQLFVYYLLIWN